jgi:hypothetical protein
VGPHAVHEWRVGYFDSAGFVGAESYADADGWVLSFPEITQTGAS